MIQQLDAWQIDGIDGKGMRADQIVALLSASDAWVEGLLRQTRLSGGGDLWGVRPAGVLAPLAAASAEAGDRSSCGVQSRHTYCGKPPTYSAIYKKTSYCICGPTFCKLNPSFSHTHDSWQIGSRVTRTNVWRSTNKHNLFDNTPSILNCKSFDFSTLSLTTQLIQKICTNIVKFKSFLKNSYG